MVVLEADGFEMLSSPPSPHASKAELTLGATVEGVAVGLITDDPLSGLIAAALTLFAVGHDPISLRLDWHVWLSAECAIVRFVGCAPRPGRSSKAPHAAPHLLDDVTTPTKDCEARLNTSEGYPEIRIG